MTAIQAISAPLGLSAPQKPNIAATRWRTVADFNAGRHFYDSVRAPSAFWVDLTKLDLHANPNQSQISQTCWASGGAGLTPFGIAWS
ncbi:hypothetical protein [Aestuariivirga sp.]|uniref:hypothetical protein n=1 Tax=Aestuariivirga sp. TaxID=2650926 RepID=UPI0035931E9C